MKTFKEITIVTPNKPGKLAEALRAVANAGANLIAIDSSSGYDLNMVRLVTTDSQETTRVLEKLKYHVTEADVLSVTILDKPGLLARVTATFGKAKVNINYMYATAAVSGHEAMVIFQLSDLTKGIRALKAANIA